MFRIPHKDSKLVADAGVLLAYFVTDPLMQGDGYPLARDIERTCDGYTIEDELAAISCFLRRLVDVYHRAAPSQRDRLRMLVVQHMLLSHRRIAETAILEQLVPLFLTEPLTYGEMLDSLVSVGHSLDLTPCDFTSFMRRNQRALPLVRPFAELFLLLPYCVALEGAPDHLCRLIVDYADFFP
jgi:hypothetical protein